MLCQRELVISQQESASLDTLDGSVKVAVLVTQKTEQVAQHLHLQGHDMSKHAQPPSMRWSR